MTEEWGETPPARQSLENHRQRIRSDAHRTVSQVQMKRAHALLACEIGKAPPEGVVLEREVLEAIIGVAVANPFDARAAETARTVKDQNRLLHDTRLIGPRGRSVQAQVGGQTDDREREKQRADGETDGGSARARQTGAVL